MKIENESKKIFLSWLASTAKFQRREVYWIINYLINHDTILKNLVFVENVEMTPRGLRLSTEESEEALLLYINDHEFCNAEQIFHDIRMNWKETLYVECVFPHRWQVDTYLGVLEDNDYCSWNSQIDQALDEQIDAYIEQERMAYELTSLYQQIDAALETHDEAKFHLLTEKLHTYLMAHEQEESLHFH